MLGPAQSAGNTGKNLGAAANFIGRLVNPDDAKNYPGQPTALDTGLSDIMAGAAYATKAFRRPRMAINDLRHILIEARNNMDPGATPPDPTTLGELKRRHQIGINQGDAVFSALSAAEGPGELRGLQAFSSPSEYEGPVKYMMQGYPLGFFGYLGKKYSGMGHHYWGRNRKFPTWLGGRKLPERIVEDPLNIKKPSGIDTGDMLKLHFQVDPSFNGGKIRKEYRGGRWSGEKLGWQKYDRLGRLWHGSPTALKVAVGSALAAAAVAGDLASDDGNDDPR